MNTLSLPMNQWYFGTWPVHSWCLSGDWFLGLTGSPGPQGDGGVADPAERGRVWGDHEQEQSHLLQRHIPSRVRRQRWWEEPLSEIEAPDDLKYRLHTGPN